jgi:hypothetical protein
VEADLPSRLSSAARSSVSFSGIGVTMQRTSEKDARQRNVRYASGARKGQMGGG